MSEKQNSKKNDTVLALCIQEISEDGSELNIGDNFSIEDVRYLHQAFVADTLVNILGINSTDVHLFYGDFPGTKKSVTTILDYLRTKLKGKKSSNLINELKITSLPAERWGIKIEKVFKKCFDDGYKHVLLVGSRTPTLKESSIKTAIKLLQKSDAAFGPTVEGRYYLIGLSGGYHVELSAHDWRSPNIYSEVVGCFREQGLTWSELELWYAVEHPEDLEYLVRDINQYRLEGDEISARETEMVLQRVAERQPD